MVPRTVTERPVIRCAIYTRQSVARETDPHVLRRPAQPLRGLCRLDAVRGLDLPRRAVRRCRGRAHRLTVVASGHDGGGSVLTGFLNNVLAAFGELERDLIGERLRNPSYS
ncbi:MAG: hypothetical protein V2A73_14085 [Pseudomonadota bacterium]